MYDWTRSEAPRWLLAALVALAASVALGFEEVEYRLSGRVAEARLEGVREVVESRRRSDDLVMQYDYRFEENGTTRRESDRVPLDWPAPKGEQLTVEYLPGRADRSRLLGHSNSAGLPLIGCGLVAVACAGGFVAYDVSRTNRRDPRNARGRS